MVKNRIEKDFLGENQISDDVYYGIHTIRGYENFDISHEINDSILIKTIAWVKKACALANLECGAINKDISNAIVYACEKIADSKYDAQFIVNPIQGGGGTSFNMTANEVIANVALEFLGYKKGDYDIINPMTHVNMSQSTNDVYPTAINLTLLLKLEPLTKTLCAAKETLHKKSQELKAAIKMGRTHLNSAAPIGLGQCFDAYASMIDRDHERITKMKESFMHVSLGGTIVGTALNTSTEYRKNAIEHLRQISGFEVEACTNLADGIQNVDDYTTLSSVLKVGILNFSKIASDLRLLGSDPQHGFGEILLPPRQMGSSFMPEKVNPVMAELVNQVSFIVCGYDLAVNMAAQAGQLELNVYKPTISYCLFKSVDIMAKAINLFERFCLKDLQVSEKLKL